MLFKPGDEPILENYPPLRAWFDKVRAAQTWQIETWQNDRSMNGHIDRLEGWAIRGAFVIVVIRSHKRGWDVFTSPNTTNIEETLAEIERRIGI